ncbi:MAG: hypothetical protein SV186_00180 [Candidatus Nanohaloarchaea archaeon]|nr:hypothetical protein [Candidatus Nanohaloarchaea archaeon]
MGLLSGSKKCAQCGKDLSDVEDVVEQGGKKFCSKDHAETFEEEHSADDHDDEEDRDVCEFC